MCDSSFLLGGFAMSDHHFWLSETQFARLEPLLPNKPRGVPRVDDRRVISGIIHVIRGGLMWRDAPGVYGPPKTLYNRFIRWSRIGVSIAATKGATHRRKMGPAFGISAALWRVCSSHS